MLDEDIAQVPFDRAHGQEPLGADFNAFVRPSQASRAM